jgi:glycosyltransferase involved in cell wall biosynthesis
MTPPSRSAVGQAGGPVLIVIGTGIQNAVGPCSHLNSPIFGLFSNDVIPLLFLIAGTIVAIQILYLVRFLIALWHKRDEGQSLTPPVSVIVCGHDEEQNIRELLPLLLTQDYPEFEVIVVEDRSNDGTYDYLLEMKGHPRLKIVRVKFLPEHITGKKYAITLGVKAAAHDWILHTDADCRPDGPRWIRSMAAGMTTEKQFVIGYSPYFRESGFLNDVIRFEALVTGIQYMGLALLNSPYMGTGRNLAYRKSKFLSSKGFLNHQSVLGGDDDLFVNQHANRTNVAVSLGSDSLMHSVPKRTWRSYLHQKVRHLAVGKRYRLWDRLRLGLFSITWMLTWLFVLPVSIQSSAAAPLWAGFVVREGLLVLLVHRSSRTLGDRFEAWKTPLLDFHYAIYYLGTGLAAMFSKRIRWKT